jgi:hypothetical protein
VWEIKNCSNLYQDSRTHESEESIDSQFQENKGLLLTKHRHTDEMIDGALGGGINTNSNKRQKSLSQSLTSTPASIAYGCAFSTPASSIAPHTESVSFAGATPASAKDHRGRVRNHEDDVVRNHEDDVNQLTVVRRTMKSGNCYDHQSPTPFVVRNLENDHDE